VAAAIASIASDACAQENSPQPCNIPKPDFNDSAPNIFSGQQEQDLGDALAELVEAQLRVAPPGENDQLTRIGDRLVAMLPPSEIHYRFRIYEDGEINGFSVAGGHVYISRKLIAAIRNEDELAGVLAHELGHLSTHQTAIEMTRAFKIRLGVTQVGDRADIFAKVHQFFNTPEKKNESQNTEERDQLIADRVALYAVVRAGYAPESFVSFLDKISQNKGKTGNWITDSLGMTHESSQRYRAALKLIGTLPPECLARKSAVNEDFQSWLHAVVTERVKSADENVQGDRPFKLDPPLRPPLWRIRFSPDGRFILGQDENSISIIDRATARAMFRIDAPDARAAQFTPDSSSVVFDDANLRVERWSVAQARRTDVKEIVVFEGCHQSFLSQDGRSLVCIHFGLHDNFPRMSLRIIDVDTNKVLLDKPKFYESPESDDHYWSDFFYLRGISGEEMVQMVPSPDGKYVLIVFGHEAVAWDLQQQRTVSLGGRLKSIDRGRMAFVGPDQILVVEEQRGQSFVARVYSFPEGRLIRETPIGLGSVDSVTSGRYLTVRPIKDYAVGLLDPTSGKFIAASKLPSMDTSDPYAAVEDLTGGIQLGQLTQTSAKHIPLPLGPLPHPRAMAFTRDGRYLAVSVRSRAILVDLQAGKQIAVLHPFRSVWADDQDRLYLQFPEFLGQDAKEMRIALAAGTGKDLGKFDTNDWQFGSVQARFHGSGKDKDIAVLRKATLEIKSMDTQTVLWTRDFPHERPAIWSGDGKRLLLAWDMRSDSAKAEIKGNAKLEQQAASLANRKNGILLETVAAETGVPIDKVLIPEIDVTQGISDSRYATVCGEFVVVHGEHGNTAIYRLDGSGKVGEFFGTALAVDDESGLIAGVNREDEVILVDVHTGREIRRFTLGAPVLGAGFAVSKESKGKTLLALTNDQIVHRVPVNP
jgi:hypothetical protein